MTFVRIKKTALERHRDKKNWVLIVINELWLKKLEQSYVQYASKSKLSIIGFSFTNQEQLGFLSSDPLLVM